MFNLPSTTSCESGLVISGYHKKLKTMKKKYFVLYKETTSSAARLEYYDNEKKFKSGLPPKRVIKLRHCFNINRRLDTKYDFVIALSTKDGCFGIVLETDDEMMKWLDMLVTLQRCDEHLSDIRPQFDHVWQVLVQKRGLAEDKGIVGYYHVCLTSKSVTFIRIGSEKSSTGELRIANIEFFLTTIRRCGDSQCFFYMEVGRQSIIGPGELWMLAEDSLIAQNMHHMILSAMSARSDFYSEPMRKRSSSANEASKPINVLQRRQTQQESKCNNSPQSSLSFGRERCDSLPTRNRTASECSNPALTTSTVTIRNTASTGLRPLSFQRCSSSPPTNSNIGCSESEESSISLDEPDDNGCFMSYRFNSRSSDGVILEENNEDLLSSEIKCNDLTNTIFNDTNNYSMKIVEQIQENYVSMAPVKISNDFRDKKQMANICSNIYTNNELISPTPNRNSPKLEMKFPELITGNSIKETVCDEEPQFERPARAYSIGSKVEHNRIKRIGNANECEQSAIRVRAFSVGSRAKIPRSDLQRGYLVPKSMDEQNCNSNNNIFSLTDTQHYNPMLNININRDKKSTSAPLLVHKSLSSMDRMSDLMEIDFSKSSQYTHRIRSTLKSQISQSVPTSKCDDRKTITTTAPEKTDENSLHVNLLSKNINSLITTDNGYLEMKPVGDVNVNSKLNSNVFLKSSSNEYVESKPKIFNSFVTSEMNNKTFNINSAVLENNLVCDSKSANTAQQTNEKDLKQICCTALNKKDLFNSDRNRIKNTFKSLTNKNNTAEKDETLKRMGLSSKMAELNISSQFCSAQQDYVNIDNVLIEHIVDTNINNINSVKCLDNSKLSDCKGNEDRFELNNINDEPIQSKPTGNEIIQVCNSCSLQSSKSRTSPVRKTKEHHQQIQVRPKSTNSSPFTPIPISSSNSLISSSISCICSTSNGCSNNSDEQQFNNKLNNKTQLKVTSRPSSVSSEHGLYYASLDLPQCTADITIKNNKAESLVDSSQMIGTNVYAKIDFDHSDSSSSSSKNVLV